MKLQLFSYNSHDHGDAIEKIDQDVEDGVAIMRSYDEPEELDMSEIDFEKGQYVVVDLHREGDGDFVIISAKGIDFPE